MVLLLGSYLTLGLRAGEYTWRVRMGLLLITFSLPAFFYILW